MAENEEVTDEVTTEEVDTTQGDVTTADDETTEVSDSADVTSDEVVEEVSTDEDVTDEVTESDASDTDEVDTTDLTPEQLKSINKELREENAKRRVATKQLDETFEGADDDFKNAWLELAQAYLQDPASVQDVFKALAGAQTTEDAIDAVTESAIPPVTDEVVIAKVQEVFARKEAEILAKEEASLLAQEVRKLGYDENADPGSYGLLWHFVSKQTKGTRDLDAAHESVKAYEQAIFDKKLSELKSSNQDVPPLAGSQTVSEKASPEDDLSLEAAKQRMIQQFRELKDRD